MLLVARRVASFGLSLAVAVSCLSVVCAQDYAEPCQPRWHTEAWWRMKAQEPVGARQYDCKGKEWPPYPRPVGPEQPLCHIYHAEHYWPWPYMCTDRHVVLDMSRTQEANGWLSETTLYDYHFNADTNELTVPGKLHLKWILEYVPPSYRTVWVQQTDDPTVAQQRMSNVRAAAIRYAGQPNVPMIAFRMAMPPGRPAIEVDTIRRHELDTIPKPRIPFEASASGASSTSGGGQNR